MESRPEFSVMAGGNLAAARSSNRTRSTTTGRVPPHNLDAEDSLLGAMLLSKDAIAAAVEGCSANDFYKPAHGHVFDAIVGLYGAGEPADPVTVAEQLRRAGLLDAIGGPATLITLQANTPATTNAARYARIVEEHALLRRLIGVAGEIAEMGYGLPEDVAEALDRAESLVFEVAERKVTDTLRPLHQLAGEFLDRLEALFDRGEAITGVPTGFLDLDDRLSGLQPSNLIILGARPSMGKTAMSLNIAAHAAMESQVPVLFFSLEMSHSEVTQRLLCSEARVDSTRVRNGKLLESDWPKISHAIGRLGEAPLYVDDNPNLTIMEIRAKARRLRSRLGSLGLIVVDYLQLMSGRHSAENRQVEVSEISRGLKILARELEVPVLALSQLSRNLEMRADKRPMLADLRESGCLSGATEILRADTATTTTMADLEASGERNIAVWTADETTGELTVGVMSHVFASGTKATFGLELASGRRVEGSANHPFLTRDGWVRLDQLQVGSPIAVADPAGNQDGTDVHQEGYQLAWDKVAGVEALGDQAVYDATVAGTHNFVANGIVAHNSLEQDADVVMFLYRDEVYNPDSPDRGICEVSVAKHRSGPTGICRLAFLESHTKFANMARV